MLVCSAGVVLLIGSCAGDTRLPIIGALVYLANEIANLFSLYRASKLFQTGVVTAESKVEKILSWLRGLVFFAGLILLVVGEKKSNEYTIAGGIIVGGTVVCFLASGWIFSAVTGIPLDLYRGEWRIRGTRPRRRR